VIISSFITILNGVFQSLVIPKYIGVTQFGYFKYFGFYVGLVGLAHLGFNDGILVRYGHYSYENLPKKKFRTFFYFLLFTQVVAAIFLGGLLGIFSTDINKKIIFIVLAINVILLNITTFFAFICQISQRFDVFSVNTILQNILNIMFISLLIFLGNTNYLPYIMAQSLVNLLILIKYLIQLKDIVIGEKENIFLIKNEIISNYKIGFFVLIGNFMGIIILGVDRIFIDNSLSIEHFSYYSFAISLLGLVFTIINSLSIYLYPYIAREREQLNAKSYEYFSLVCILVASYSLCTFFIIKYIVMNYLEEYLKSMVISAVLYPIIILRSIINIVSINFYKALQLVRDYNNNNVIAFVITLIINIIVIYYKPNLLNFSIGTLISFYLWTIYTDFYFYRKLKVKILKNHIFIILVIMSFFFSTTLSNILGFFIYILIISVLVVVFYKKLLLDLINKFC
jgi:O-antigen/teichoic acid export membrane protein